MKRQLRDNTGRPGLALTRTNTHLPQSEARCRGNHGPVVRVPPPPGTQVPRRTMTHHRGGHRLGGKAPALAAGGRRRSNATRTKHGRAGQGRAQQHNAPWHFSLRDGRQRGDGGIAPFDDALPQLVQKAHAEQQPLRRLGSHVVAVNLLCAEQPIACQHRARRQDEQ
jgi:hypothetical protein